MTEKLLASTIELRDRLRAFVGAVAEITDCGPDVDAIVRADEAIAAWNRRTPAPEGEVVGDPVLWKDRPDEWTDAILAAHPVNSTDPERHNRFALAMKMVGNRHGKYELVGLVHWLLTRLDAASPAPEGEVVAWRVRGPRGGWMHSDVLPSSWRNAQPLYASPVVPVGGEEIASILAAAFEDHQRGAAAPDDGLFEFMAKRILAALGTKATDTGREG
jgi:hypothetical protein